MLGKLFKYEFKGSYKLMLTIYGITIAISILGALVFSTSAIQNMNQTGLPANILGLLFVAVIILYVLTAFALSIITYVYMCTRFYKTMYSNQGYLTHTLPVKPLTTFHVKLITSLVWMFSSILIMFLSIFILLCGITKGNIFSHAAQNTFTEELLPFLGMSTGQMVAFIIFACSFSCLSYLLMVFASASIGQLFHQNKVGFSILAGIILYFIQQIAGIIVIFLFNESMFSFIEDTVPTFADILFSPYMLVSISLALFFTVACYVICIVIVQKHLNLD